MRRNSISFPIAINQSSSCSSSNLSARSTRSLSFKSTKRPKLSEDEKVRTFNYINDFENAEKELFKHETLDEPITTSTPTSADTSSTSPVFVDFLTS